MKNGIVAVKKEEGMTSQAVVNRVKRIFGVSKAGHTGTLDPMATGVLPVLIGRAVKASEYMLTSDKHYIALMRLGIVTDTEDITGNLLESTDNIPTKEEVMRAVLSMQGESLQTPPMYSAIKVGGKKLCDIARAGGEVDRTPRNITVYSISAEPLTDTDYRLFIHCSKGTYIRTLISDIGKKLSCGAAMAALCRSSASVFGLEDTKTLSELEEMTEEQRDAFTVPTEKIFADLPRVTLAPFFARLARSGLEIYLKKIGKSELSVGERVTLYDENGFFALGEVRSFEEGDAIKPIKQLD